jgi:KTSC domain
MHLQSHAIEAIAYEENSRLLRVRYRDSGRTEVYENVPQEIYDSLIFAESIGGFFRAHIEGRFPRREN